jgi:hypothetical protein
MKMIGYKRKTARRLLFFRLLGILIFLLTVFLFLIHSLFAYLLLILAIPASLFHVPELTINDHSVIIAKFYFFGWIKIQKLIQKTEYNERITIDSYCENNSGGPETGHWIDLVGCLVIFSESKLYRLRFKYKKRNGEWITDHLKLTREEYDLIHSIINK